MSRVSLKSNNTAVIIGTSPAYKTENESGYLFSSVQSASFGFSSNFERSKQIGYQELASNERLYHPTVDLGLSYVFSSSMSNEDVLGFNFGIFNRAQKSFLYELDEKSYNFYFYNHPEDGQDAIEYLKEGVNSPNGGEVISFGNAFLKNYSLNYSIGESPIVDVSFDCSNLQSELYTSTPLLSPAINLDEGDNQFVGGFNIEDTIIVEEDKYLFLDVDRSDLIPQRPSDFEFSITDLSIGGQSLSFQKHILNSFNLDISLSRSESYKLGSNFICDRALQFPRCQYLLWFKNMTLAS